MNRRLRNRLLAALALALVVGGGTLAAVTAAQDSGRPARHPATTIGVAAAYLGIGEGQLRKDVRSGQSLSELARSTGHSTQGLIDAIVAARRAHLEAQLAQLSTRVSAQVTHSGRARLHPAGGAGRHRAASAAAAYLGLSRAQLIAKLRSGETLAQIAEATPGHSRAGLIAALLAKRRARLDARVAAGAITPAQEQKWLARMEARVGARVDRAFNARTHAHAHHRR